MGSITTGIGLVSGINTAQLIDSLITLESRGKFSLQKRVSDLGAQRTALLDINARLLNLKSASKAFRLDKIFQSSTATTSNEEVIAATAGKGAQPGTFQFIVKQLVSTSQKLSQGFADKTVTPLGLESLSFEFGRGGLSVNRDLEQLNAGQGVDRGRITITDRAGATATIDLTDVTTLNEVLDRINASTGVDVTASVDGDRVVITDTTGATTSNLIVANAAGDTTATDLGIVGSVASATLTGTNINTIGGSTALSSLNDGTGVLIRDNIADFTITARDSTALSVSLGRVDAPISNATLLSDLNNGQGITISDDDENKDIAFVDREGLTHEVNLTDITTVGGLISRVASATGGKVVLSINADGQRLTVTDTTPGTGLLKVLGAGDNGTDTAEDLGILNVAGVSLSSFNGSIIPNTITDPPAANLNDVIERIHNATGNNGKIVASIAADGVSLLITDTTGGPGNLIIRRTFGNSQAANALGIETSVLGDASSTVDGRRLIAGLGSVLVNNLNGGAGLSGNTALSIQDRAGGIANITIDENASLSDVIAQINNSGAIAITASFNSAGNGLLITDTSGGVGNLIIGDTAAAALGIDTGVAGVASTTVRGSNLQHRYVSQATRLSDLNYGRGIGLGKFRITDGLGESAVIDIGSDATSLQDIIAEINSRGLAINARVNDTGDGLLIEADLELGETAATAIKISAVSGSTAKDLNILGTSSTIENAKIDGSYERTVSLATTDNLAKVVSKINQAGIPVSASIINSGSGATPFRLNITSAISGRLGELLIDSGDVDLGFTSLTTGKDAKIFFGSNNAEDGQLITSSSNKVTNVLEGVTLDLLQESDDAVTITVERDAAAIVDAVKQFVTTFNDSVARINQYDFFDVDTQKRGALLGDSTTSRVREGLYRVLQQKAEGVNSQYQYLRQVGVTIGSDGQLKFNQDKFDAAYANDSEAVENLFATFNATPPGTTVIAVGVTIQETEQNVTARGFGDLFGDLLDKLTNTIDGTVTLADQNFEDQIELANKRITIFDERLEAKRIRLENQFAAMEAALAKLQGQSGSLSSLASSVALAQTSGLR